MSDFDLRPLTDAQLPELRRLTNYAFAVNTPAAEQPPNPLQADWTLGAFDGTTLAACSGAFPLRAQMNGNSCAVQGITAVATDPGYRRRGLLRQMMQHWVQRAEEEDVAFSLLWASLGAIYQRFGYGLGSTDISYSANPKDLTFTRKHHTAGGRVSTVELDAASDDLKTIHRQFISGRNLMLQRSTRAWQRLSRHKPTHCAIYRSATGRPEGAVLYTSSWDGLPGPNTQQTLTLVDVMWLNMDAYQALWEFLLAHDLVNKIDWMHVPEDDPLPLLLLEPRRLNRRVDDGTWLRVINAQAGLKRRGYSSAGHATLKLVDDELCPWNNGIWRLETDGTSTEVSAENKGALPTATLNPAALAVLISGSVRATDLAHSGRIDVQNAAALPQLDTLFAPRYRPWCPDHF